MTVKEKLRLTPRQADLASEHLRFSYWLIHKWYQKYKYYGYDAVYDRGINALIKAARNWDENGEASFKTYLTLNTNREMLKIPRDANVKKRSGFVTSFDAVIGDLEQENGTLHDVVGKSDRYEFIYQDLLKNLTEREKTAIHQNLVEGKKQAEIAEEMGVSQMHVSRIIKKGLKKMREEI